MGHVPLQAPLLLRQAPIRLLAAPPDEEEMEPSGTSLNGLVSRALPQPHARPAPVLGDELDAGRFKGGADRGEGAGLRLATSYFKIRQRRHRYP